MTVLTMSVLTWAEHQHEQSALLGHGGFCRRHDLDPERAKLRRQLQVHVALGSDMVLGTARGGHQLVVRAEVEHRAIDDLLRQVELIAQAHPPEWPVRARMPLLQRCRTPQASNTRADAGSG